MKIEINEFEILFGYCLNCGFMNEFSINYGAKLRMKQTTKSKRVNETKEFIFIVVYYILF